MSQKKYLWIIGGGEMQIPSIEEARQLHLSVIVSDLNPDCVCAPLADIFLPVDIFDIDGHISAAKNLVRSGTTIAGVFAAGIDAPETMAALAKSLGIYAVDPAIARLVHHKASFRSEMERLGFPVPKFAKINRNDLSRISAIAMQIGYPLIIKNTDSSGSRGTQIFYAPDDNALQETAKLAINVSKSGEALIESFWSGPEQTVETLYDVNGQFYPCFITDRVFDKSQGFALETALIHPSTLPSTTQAEMYEIAKKVADAIGIKVGAAKYDMILTPEGPRIIEMTVRLSGGFDCQYLVPAATGKNILKAGILTAIGQTFSPDLLQDKLGRVALSRSLWPAPGKVVAIRNLDQARKLPNVEKIIMRLKAGDVVDPYIDCTKRTCFIIVSGSNFQEAEKAFDAVANTLQIETLQHE